MADKLLEKKSNLKVIYTSGYDAETSIQDIALNESINFLPKPFEADKLANIVRNILDSDTSSVQSAGAKG